MQKLFEGSRRIREAFGVAGFSLWDVTHFGTHVVLPGDLKHAQPAMALHVGHTYVVTRHRAQPKHPFASLWVDDGFGPCMKIAEHITICFASFRCEENDNISFFGKSARVVTATTLSFGDTLHALGMLVCATRITHPTEWHRWVGSAPAIPPAFGHTGRGLPPENQHAVNAVGEAERDSRLSPEAHAAATGYGWQF